MKKRLLLEFRYAVVVFLLGGFYAGWVSITRLAIPCPFHLLTGLRCPGCGITRMCMALLQGDIKKAVSYNIGISITAPVGMFVFLKREIRYIRTGEKSFTKKEMDVLWGIVAVLVVFGIVRNFVGI